MANLNSMVISTRSKLVSELSIENLDDLYNGLPYRYNSVTDLVFQKDHIKESLLQKLNLQDRLFYKIFFVSNSTSYLPILECLEIDGISGGMLSSYLHDLDREILEGEGDFCFPSQSILFWQSLLAHSEFSFVFPSSHSRYSRTSIYMNKIGFYERSLGRLRCFFNGIDKSDIFVDVMQELIAAIHHKNSAYSFDHEQFRIAKVQQAKVAKQWALSF